MIRGRRSDPAEYRRGNLNSTSIHTMTYEFERLEYTVGMIKRHPYYPGKELLLDECLEDIDDRFRQGRLTAEQRGRLREILLEPTEN
jgi:hypothetical protein